jgi:hypothetical protein
VNERMPGIVVTSVPSLSSLDQGPPFHAILQPWRERLTFTCVSWDDLDASVSPEMTGRG